MKRKAIAFTAALSVCASLVIASVASAAAPSIPFITFSAVGTNSVTLEVDVNPEGKKTFYHFEYGPAPCGANPCTSVPVPEGEIAPGVEAVRVSAPVGGLSPLTTYHFRVIAKNGKNEIDTTVSPNHTLTTFPLPQVFDTCPNDALRLGAGELLPDCRAYEQASPVDKNGVSLYGHSSALKASPAGDAISFESSSVIPGGDGAQNFPYFLARRGGGSWATQGILPHASAGDLAKVLGWTPDFSQTFSRARRLPANEAALFARSSADGSLTPVVDYRSPGDWVEGIAFAGSAPDGSVAFFEANAQLLPAAAKGKPNLYAWERDAGTLLLAGVFNDGKAPSGGSFAGSYDWVKGTNPPSLATGGSRGSYYTQDQNAISANADRVFFTAGGSGQLYMRRNPTEPQSALDGQGKCTEPAKACTIQISASQKDNGKGEGGTDSVGARPAAFMAASADGSKVFFTSSEKLTNNATTGPEPDAIRAIAKAEVDGDPVDIDFIPTSAAGIDVDDEHVYWINPEKETIARAELDGDAKDEAFISLPEVEVKPGELVPANAQDVAVDSEHIYWTNATNGEKETGTIGRADIDGDPGSIDPECVTGASNPRGIDTEGTHVYWANASEGTFGRANINCEESNQKYSTVHFDNELSFGFVLTSSHIYYTSTLNAAISSLNRAQHDGTEWENGGGIGNFDEASAVAVDAGHAYWGDDENNSIGRISLDFDFENRNKQFIEDAGFPEDLATDGTHLYWSANQDIPPNPGNDLYRYDAASGDLTDLTVHGASPNGAEVRGVLGASDDGSHIYFAANGVLTSAPNPEGEVAVPGNCAGTALDVTAGICNLYLWDEGQIEFVARLSAGGGTAVTDALNWAPTVAGATTSETYKTSRVSPDGETLLFRSRRQLTDYDNEGVPHLYRYDAGEESLLCLSCNPSGKEPSSAPTFASIKAVLISAGDPAALLSRNLSADGDRAFFETSDSLVAGDINANSGCPAFDVGEGSYPGCRDVYMWEAKGSGSCESDAQNGGCLYLLSTGTSAEPSFLADASLSGDDAFFLTSEQLVRQDEDELFDVYDASVNGGLKAQAEPPPLPCEGEACLRGASAAPSTQSAGTATFAGPPNPKAKKPKPRCPKGKRQVRRRGKVRCVPRQKRAKRAQRRAHNDGRAHR